MALSSNENESTLLIMDDVGASLKNNETEYRTRGDWVSMLGSLSQNVKTLSNNSFFDDPINSHDLKNIKNQKIFI